jgi:alpha-galactosidase
MKKYLFASLLFLISLKLLSQDIKVSGNGVTIDFELFNGKHLRQLLIYPDGFNVQNNLVSKSADVNLEVAVHCTGESYSGIMLVDCQPAMRLEYISQKETTTLYGKKLVFSQYDPNLKLRVESIYEFFSGTSTIRRYTRLINESGKSIGIDHVSSAMINNYGNIGKGSFEDKLIIHKASNSWMAEGQWKQYKPSELGWSENGKSSRSGIFSTNLGSMSTVSDLPFAMVENKAVGITWFWQIEHNGSWHWEMSNYRNNFTNSIDNNYPAYIYLGGPDERHHHAWKELKPGETYETVKVAIGVVKGGFEEAVEEATKYRRIACLRPHQNYKTCPVIFNDYMNCLEGNPTTEKELPLIEAAAKAGCNYFVIDAGWYSEINESWGETVGMWKPGKTRWPNGIKEVIDSIRNKGMIPGLWLEIECAGTNSPLKNKPDSWFFMRHGKRVENRTRYFLDFRNPEVIKHADEVIDRVVNEYGAGYIKMDYNRSALMGTETNACSMGQGLLEHQKAYLKWIDNVLLRHPGLIIENCGSGGGRMDYAMLSRHHLQSVTDQTDYTRIPSIITGSIAAVLPEQLAGWSYPLKAGNKYEASFNMVNVMMLRIFQSGALANLTDESFEQVEKGIKVYKNELAEIIPECIPFFPLGMPALEDHYSPVALGLKHEKADYYAIWRLQGKSAVNIPLKTRGHAEILYPTDLSIEMETGDKTISLKFPKPEMAVIIKVIKE